MEKETIKLTNTSIVPRYEKWCKSLTDQGNTNEVKLHALSDLTFEETDKISDDVFDLCREVENLKTSVQMLSVGLVGSILILGCGIISILI